MNSKSEHQAPGLSALGESQPTITPQAAAVRPIKPTLPDDAGVDQIVRLLLERDTLQAIATGAALKFAGMELQRDELSAAVLDVCGPLFTASDGGAMWCSMRERPNASESVEKLKAALALCEKAKS